MPTRTASSTRAVTPALMVAFSILLLGGCGDDGAASDRSDADATAPDIGVNFDLPGFDVPNEDAGTDPDRGDDAQVGECRADSLEPSSLRNPVSVDESASWTDLTICEFEDDWFEIALLAGERVEAVLSASYVDGDLDLQLFAPDLTFLGASTTRRDEERIVYGASGDETVLLRVFGSGRDENRYDLELAFERFADDCDGDAEEPNDTAGSALDVDSPFELVGRICVEDVDWFGVSLPAGETFSARLDLEHRLGDLDLRLYIDGQLDAPVAESRQEIDFERVEAGPFDADVRLLLEVYGFRGAVNDYALALRTLPPADTSVTIAGVVRYEDRPFGPEGFTGDRVERPARGFRVELVRAFDGAVVAVQSTDEAGAYGLTAAVHSNEGYYLRALSTFEAQTFEGRVEDRSEAEQLYAVAGEPFTPASADGDPVDLVAAAADPPGGAFNILDVTWDGYSFVRSHTDQAGDPLTYRWEPGQAFSCRSCYFNGVISLGGQVEDADEYDDDIVLHEFGHYFQDYFSADDSPGGRHNGERLNPLLAYGEGMATFFSSMVQGDPEYVDIYIDSQRLRDLETADEDPDEFYGTTDDDITGDVSEYLVAAVMWDTIDGASEDEPFDTVAAEVADVMTVFMDYLRDSDRPDIGVRGIDLADWLNGMTCTFPEVAGPLESLVVEDRDFPWDAETHSDCPGKADDSLPVEIVEQGDSLWLLGLPEAAVVNVMVDRGAGWKVAPHACSANACELPVAADKSLTLVVTGQAARRPLRASWLGDVARARLLGTYRLGLSPAGAVREWPSR